MNNILYLIIALLTAAMLSSSCKVSSDGAPKSEQRIDPYGRVTQADLGAAIKRLQEVNN